MKNNKRGRWGRKNLIFEKICGGSIFKGLRRIPRTLQQNSGKKGQKHCDAFLRQTEKQRGTTNDQRLLQQRQHHIYTVRHHQ